MAAIGTIHDRRIGRANTDNRPLSRRARRAARRQARARYRPVESTELGAMLRRVLRALERRAQLERDLPAFVVAAGRGAHDGPASYSWTEIGRALDVSRQAARQRFGGALTAENSATGAVTAA